MLATLGYGTLDELTAAALPAGLSDEALDLPQPVDEAGALAQLCEMASLNHPGRAMIGLGYYGTLTPAVIKRDVAQNPGWYTAYTPYQPEISQGRLEALLVFQTMVADLTGLPCAGASLLDEATAVAEAVAMAMRGGGRGRSVVFVDEGVFESSQAVLRTRSSRLGAQVEVVDVTALTPAQLATACAVVVQTPTSDGHLQPTASLAAMSERAHQSGALVVAAADLLALALVAPPGQWGADIAVGTTQRFGVPLFFGGPHAAYLACGESLVRQMPGRLVGVSIDADGKPALRTALQTREQHIRREKATSNICTAQALVAILAAFYAVYHGPEGLRGIAQRLHDETRALAGDLVAAGFTPAYDSFFDTLWVPAGERAKRIWAAAHDAGVQLRCDMGPVGEGHIGISIGEDATVADLAVVRAAFGASRDAEPWGALGATPRTDEYMTHPVFHVHRSETQMRRYMHSLVAKDYALDQGMIPLGSCTMKLTPAVAAEAWLLPGFTDVHPFVPAGDARGYARLMSELGGWLEQITGYDAVSFQPNGGSQGELAGLLAIRAYHEARGESGRDMCLIPGSAHGTNAASAAMAGLSVVVVAVAPDGSIDVDDLTAKVAEYGPRLAAIMVTYPSTHGVFETTMSKVAELAHGAGAQVYVDGANLNALAGLAKPGHFGADIGHLNLHKTFAMPHGGGGPGVGPIMALAHLAPYLPAAAHHQVAGAPHGSAGMLPISHAYIAL
ncbi:MAG: beta-eliminating lyase-related protein, partial [Micrococcales bacterium]|nr:beta-eliminating lyase-related protein [Micrococcales bacterium]